MHVLLRERKGDAFLVETLLYGLTEAIKKRFDKEGISFPFPQQDVHLYKASEE